MNQYSEEYLRQMLEWTKQRMETLDKIETKLYKMRELAKYAMDNKLSEAKKQEINDRIQKLQGEVNELNEKNRVSWMINQ